MENAPQRESPALTSPSPWLRREVWLMRGTLTPWWTIFRSCPNTGKPWCGNTQITHWPRTPGVGQVLLDVHFTATWWHLKDSFRKQYVCTFFNGNNSTNNSVIPKWGNCFTYLRYMCVALFSQWSNAQVMKFMFSTIPGSSLCGHQITDLTAQIRLVLGGQWQWFRNRCISRMNRG